MILRGRTSKTGLAILGCCFTSVAWAAATASSVRLPNGGVALFDSVRLSAWLLFAVALVTIRAGDGSGLGRLYLFAALAFCVAAIANDARLLLLEPTVSGFYTSQLLIRIGFGVIGLLTIENLWRNTEPQRRWHVWPLCLALGVSSPMSSFSSRMPSSLAAGSIPDSAWAAQSRQRSWRHCWPWRWREIENGGSTNMYHAKWCFTQRRCWRAAAFFSPWPSWGWCCASSEGIGGSSCSWRCFRQHCPPRDRALLREPAPPAQIFDLTKLFHPSVRLSN